MSLNQYLCHLLIGASPLVGAAQALGQAEPTLLELASREGFFGSWRLADNFPPARIARLLEKFALETHGHGFRSIGEKPDFFHGHILYTMDELTADDRLKPVAILYHTQEGAHDATWSGKVDAKYGYLDHRARNWLQWVHEGSDQDGVTVENARQYLDEKTKLKPRVFFDEAPPLESERYTIPSWHLDPVKLGYNVVAEVEFDFFAAACDEKPNTSQRGPIVVSLPDGTEHCLMLDTSSAGFADIRDFRASALKRPR